MLPGLRLAASATAHGLAKPSKYVSNKCIAVRKVATCHTATGTHMPHWITQCYLPPGRGDIPALTPDEAGTRYNTIQYNTKFVKRHVAVASEALANRTVKKHKRRRTNVL